MMLAAALALPLGAQYICPAKSAQIQIMETGVGVLTEDLDLLYSIGRSDYKTNIYIQNKVLQRELVNLSAEQQKKLAEKVDSFLTDRAKIESLNLVDMQVDLAYEAEHDKIDAALNRLKRDINKISRYDGQIQLRADWMLQYNMLAFGYKVIRESVMPNSERHEQYIKIFNDINRHNEILRQQLITLEYERSIHDVVQAQPVRPAAAAEIARRVLDERLTSFAPEMKVER